MSLGLRVLTDEEVAGHDAWWKEHATYLAWREWELFCCTERGGHWWQLTIDPDEGVSLECAGCRAGPDDLVPDGLDLIGGVFRVSADYVLTLDSGCVIVNDRWQDKHTLWSYEGLPIAYGWKGPVTAEVRVEKYPGGPWGGPEWDVFIDLEAA